MRGLFCWCLAVSMVAGCGSGVVKNIADKDGSVLEDGGNVGDGGTAVDAMSNADANAGADAGTVEPELLFWEGFDTEPFNSGRWDVYFGDCSEAQPGTVRYATDEDGCGASGGYVSREYLGDRCIVYQGPPFTTAGYTDLELSFAYRLAGERIRVSVLTDGVWTEETGMVTGSGMGAWALERIQLNGVITGIRFWLLSSQDNTERRLDCIGIHGVPECTPSVEVTTQPTPAQVCPGGNAAFDVTATSPGSNLSYRWQKDGANLSDNSRISGSQTGSLHIQGAEAGDAGEYRCVVSGDNCTAVSAEATLTLSAAPTIVAQPSSQTIQTQHAASFTVSAMGSGALSYQWRLGGVALSNGGHISGADTATLSIDPVQVSDAGSYHCVVTDDCGSTPSSAATLTVNELVYETEFHHTTTGSSDGGKSLVLCPGQTMDFDSCDVGSVNIPRHGDDNGRETYWNMFQVPIGDIVCMKNGTQYRYRADAMLVYGQCP